MKKSLKFGVKIGVKFVILYNKNYYTVFSISQNRQISPKSFIFLGDKNATIFVKEAKVQIKHRIYENTLYVVLSGELDENSAYNARTNLDEIFDMPKFKQIIIDLSELDFMDSTGIGVLIGRYKRMKDKQIPIFICNPSTHAERIFKMTGLYDIMPRIS